ncbi:MAG: hypothetical protein A2711_07075 [Burkholderiales bacterium RIFCSPHIGHO2_01_FULL_63_240]|nr:MAG: hypothetical protein A2711_07075 [Burkholderiales bacterium RIFCSPHIGHO2_01_FULL_63_240]
MSERTHTLLGEAITQDSVRAVHFFNGRLLTASDLSRDQAARRQADAQVGAATGSGIAWGLEVNAAGPASDAESLGVVTVEAGLAVALSGQALRLNQRVSLSLIQPPADTSGTSGGALQSTFGPCVDATASTYVAGDGLLLLTLSPIDVPEGFAPVLALEAVNTRCARDVIAEGVQLKLLPIPGGTISGTTSAALAQLRNRIAHECLGSSLLRQAHRQPTTTTPRATSAGAHGHSLLDRMLAERSLSACDVPLALVCLIGRQIAFIDGAAVRRRIAAQTASVQGAAWLGERLQGTAEARFLQFQEQLADTPAIAAAAATVNLSWLPPAGLLPAGTDWRRFFADRAPARVTPLAASDAPGVLQRALTEDAIDLTAPAASGRVRVHEIEGSGAPLLFVRDSRNVQHAERTWLDGARSGLGGVGDVQAAIDALRSGSFLHTVIHPGMSPQEIHAAFKKLQGNARTLISFEPGEYQLGKPLILREAGHVEIRGHRALLGESKSERVLIVRDCESLVLEGLTLVGDAIGRMGREALREALSFAGLDDDDDGTTLGGALTVQDTPQVRLLDVKASVAADEGLGAMGITVHDLASIKAKRNEARMHVDIGHCTVTVGANQGGILCVNARRARVHDNVLGAEDPDKPMRCGIVVAGSSLGSVRVDRNLVEGSASGIAVATALAGDPKPGKQAADRVGIAHNDIQLSLQGADRLGCFGVAVGNAENVQVAHNEVRADAKFAKEAGLQAIRLQGAYGSQLMVQDNFISGAETGIDLHPTTQPTGRVLWLVAGNVGEQVGKLIDAQASAHGLITQRENLEN